MNETEVLFAEKLISNFNDEKYVDWAISLMEKGYESESLYILAGLSNDDSETREKYFKKSIQELDLKIENDRNALIDSYAIHIALQVISRHINAFKGLEIFENIIRETNYDKKYLSFFDLDEDLNMLNYKNSDRVKFGISKEEKENFIYQEFKLFLDNNI